MDKCCPFGSVYSHHQLCLLSPRTLPLYPQTPPSAKIDLSTRSHAHCSSGWTWSHRRTPRQLVSEVHGCGMCAAAVNTSVERRVIGSVLIVPLTSVLGLLHINWLTSEESLKKKPRQRKYVCKLTG